MTYWKYLGFVFCFCILFGLARHWKSVTFGWGPRMFYVFTSVIITAANNHSETKRSWCSSIPPRSLWNGFSLLVFIWDPSGLNLSGDMGPRAQFITILESAVHRDIYKQMSIFVHMPSLIPLLRHRCSRSYLGTAQPVWFARRSVSHTTLAWTHRTIAYLLWLRTQTYRDHDTGWLYSDFLVCHILSCE